MSLGRWRRENNKEMFFCSDLNFWLKKRNKSNEPNNFIIKSTNISLPIFREITIFTVMKYVYKHPPRSVHLGFRVNTATQQQNFNKRTNLIMWKRKRKKRKRRKNAAVVPVGGGVKSC